VNTVQKLIEKLNEIENKDQAIIYAYFLAEDFEYGLGDVHPTAEEFATVAKEEGSSWFFEEAAEHINNAVYDEIAKRDN
jgi:predicted RNA-binding protein with EMAP domain